MTNLGRNLSIACRYAVVISIWKKLEEIYQWLVCRYAVGISICWNRTVISRQSWQIRDESDEGYMWWAYQGRTRKGYLKRQLEREWQLLAAVVRSSRQSQSDSRREGIAENEYGNVCVIGDTLGEIYIRVNVELYDHYIRKLELLMNK